jgi:hypothetical protein
MFFIVLGHSMKYAYRKIIKGHGLETKQQQQQQVLLLAACSEAD